MKSIHRLFIAFVAFVTLTGMISCQSPEPLFPDTPGLVSFTHRKSFEESIPKTLDTIQSLGITDMEFSNLFGETPENLRQMLDDRNIFCSSFGVGYEELTTNTQEVAKKAVADFNRVGKILREHGLTFCYHNHGYEFRPYKDGTYFDYLVQHTDSENVSFEMDILWVKHPGQDPAKLLDKYGDRFKLMHLKDLKKGIKGDYTGWTSQENDVALATGQLNIPEVLKAAEKAGVKHYYIEDESKLKSTQVPETIAYLKSLKE